MLNGERWQTGPMAERDLLVLSEEPLNAETRLDETTPAILPAGRHYVRTHFPIPNVPRELVVDGANPRTFSREDVRALPARTLAVTLECAGNGRRFLEPTVPGEQWGLGAVGTAHWTGASLRSLLDVASIPDGTVEVLFRGADEGVPKDLGTSVAYERSLPTDAALREDVIVAYAMNGEPIPREHGGPLRLIVPGWYGMASVKWLARVTPLDRPFVGFYQTDRYVIDGRPLREVAPRAVITSPAEGAEIRGPVVEIRGYAWSGAARIDRVQIGAGTPASIAGNAWRSARLEPAPSTFAWCEFALKLTVASTRGSRAALDLVARAVDAAGNVQPLVARWNPLGYMNNAARPVRIRVTS
jgi:DMSO/TMAO reductase YedYZ molybdopterin-dependent catalytic subunit